LKGDLQEECRGGGGLLQAMELMEDGLEGVPNADQMVLEGEVIAQIQKARENDMLLRPCEKQKRDKPDQWGPVLVERHRRVQNGVIMLTKAMKLKENKNMGVLRGNSFASLHIDSLNQMARDVKISLGINTSKAEVFINKLIEEEKNNLEKFVGDNLEMLLPADLEVEIVKTPKNVIEEDSPAESIKDSTPSPKWKKL
jgi:hypothetical protein